MCISPKKVIIQQIYLIRYSACKMYGDEAGVHVVGLQSTGTYLDAPSKHRGAAFDVGDVAFEECNQKPGT